MFVHPPFRFWLSLYHIQRLFLVSLIFSFFLHESWSSPLSIAPFTNSHSYHPPPPPPPCHVYLSSVSGQCMVTMLSVFQPSQSRKQNDTILAAAAWSCSDLIAKKKKKHQTVSQLVNHSASQREPGPRNPVCWLSEAVGH